MKIPRSSLPLLTALITALATTKTQAGWPADGLVISDTTQNRVNEGVAVSDDGFGGVYVGWRSLTEVNDSVPWLKRLTAAGDPFPGWPAAGVRLPDGPLVETCMAIVPDGIGGVYVVLSDTRGIFSGNGNDYYLQRVLEDGNIAPGWPPDGIPVVVKPQNQLLTSAMADGGGGILIGWQDNSGDGYECYGARFLPNGALAPGWPTNGKPLVPTPGFQSGPEFVLDGQGGVLMAYSQALGSPSGDWNFYARHLDTAGEVLPGWPVSDMTLTAAPNDQGGYIVSDGAGGLYASWQDDRSRPVGVPFNEFWYDIYAQHLLADGTIAPGWPVDGLPVCVLPRAQQYPEIVSDGAGGMITIWQEVRDFARGYDLYGARIRSDGSRAPGWANDGQPVMITTSSTVDYRIAIDGTGGVYSVAPGFPDSRVWVQHTMGNGQPETGWPVEGQLASSVPASTDWAQVAWDGYGGAYVAWDDNRYGYRHVFVKHYGPDGPTAVTVSLVSAEAMPGIARLSWQASGSAAFTLERRVNSDAWQPLTTLTPSGSGRITYDDRVPEPGRYLYRLVYTDDGTRRETPDVQLDVPSTHVLSLAGFTPNPCSFANLSVAFTLPKQAAGWLRLFDVTGREIAREDLAGLGPGRHALRLGAHSRVPAGVYWMRLTHGDRIMTGRGVVVR